MATAVSSLNDVWGGGGGGSSFLTMPEPLRQKKLQEQKQQEQKQQEQKQHEQKQQEKQQKMQEQQQQLRQQRMNEQHRALLRNLSMLQQQNDMLKQELLNRASVVPHALSEAKTYATDHAVIVITLFSVLLLVVIVGFTILGCKLNKVSNSLRYVMARFGMPIH